MDAHAFWSLDRDARNARIEKATDEGTCSVCEQPILDGQPRNGSVHAHWECADLGPTPSFEKVDRHLDQALRKLDELMGRKRR
jgi:hypothetical protein